MCETHGSASQRVLCWNESFGDVGQKVSKHRGVPTQHFHETKCHPSATSYGGKPVSQTTNFPGEFTVTHLE